MFISKDPPLIFVHVPKAAGTAITKALEKVLQLDRQLASIEGHSTALEIRKHVGEEFWNRALKFGVVRNPWERRVSCWLELCKNDDLEQIMLQDFGDFAGWLRWIEKNWPPRFDMPGTQLAPRYRRYSHLSQLDYLSDESGQILVDHVLHFEKAGKHFEQLCKENIISDGELPVIYRTRSHQKHAKVGDYRSFYTEETRDIIGRVYHDSIERFGYSFDQ